MTERLLSAIRANTGDPQPPLVGAGHLFTTVCANGPLSVGQATAAMDEALERGDVIRWTDGNGDVRYGLTDDGLDAVDGSDPYGPADVGALRDYLETEVSREDPRRDIIGWVNRRLAEVNR